MHTVLVITVGLIVLGLMSTVAHLVGGGAAASKSCLAFVPLWFIASAANLYVGVRKEGYPLSLEGPVFLAVFALPASLALFAWWRLG